jgi:hypothetical protein
MNRCFTRDPKDAELGYVLVNMSGWLRQMFTFPYTKTSTILDYDACDIKDKSRILAIKNFLVDGQKLPVVVNDDYWYFELSNDTLFVSWVANNEEVRDVQVRFA